MASLAQPIGPNGRKGLSWDIFFPAIVLGVVGVFFWPAASKHTRKTLAGSVGSRSVLDSPPAQFSCSLLSSQNVTSTGLNYSSGTRAHDQILQGEALVPHSRAGLRSQ